MAYFAQVRNGVVKHTHFTNDGNLVQQKWTALFRSNVLIKNSTEYDVMPGDLFIDGKFYKKNIETGELTLLEDGAWSHPAAIRFAGIMDGEIVGQWGMGREQFKDQAETEQFIDDILNSEIIEINYEKPNLVEKNWLYDGVNFFPPSVN